jgi:hypothetical protein
MATEKQQRGRLEGWPTVGKRAGAAGKRPTLAYIKTPTPHDVITERADHILFTQDWVCDKLCLVTVDVTVDRHDVTPDDPTGVTSCRRYRGKPFFPILKEIFLTLTLGQHPLKISVFIGNSTKEFILGLDKLLAI